MVRSPEQALKALAAPQVDSPTIRMMTVSAVRDDGKVNLTSGNQVVTDAPALASYTPRAAGDVVAVAQFGAGWLVLGHAGNEAAPVLPEPTVPLIKMQRFSVAESGFSLPSSSYRTFFSGEKITSPVGFPYLTLSATLSVRARNTTAGQDYIQATIDPAIGYDAITDVAPGYVGTATGPFDISVGPFDAGDDVTLAMTARAGIAAWAADDINAAHLSGVALWRSAPSPSGVAPDSDAGYRSGSLSGDSPVQGSEKVADPAYSGAWFYGSRIKAACDTGNVDHITLTLSRAGRRHGRWAGAIPRLFLHAATTQTSRPPNLFNPTDGPMLELGETATFRLPDDWTAALSDGTARGIGCAAPEGGDYLIYGACGDLTIHFK